MNCLKRKFSDTCPDCNTQVGLHQINTEYAIEICNNLQCAFPFNRSCPEGLIHELPVRDARYSKKLKTRSSSIANTVAASTASDIDVTSVKSVKETSSYIPESSSLIKQKDKLHSKKPALSVKQRNLETQALITQVTDEDIAENITKALITKKHLPLPENIALPPITAAKQSCNTAPTSIDLSFQDIESLLSDTNLDITTPSSEPIDCSSPSSITTPKDISNLAWMKDMDSLFGVDMTQTKFNPFQGDNELDSLLGI